MDQAGTPFTFIQDFFTGSGTGLFVVSANQRIIVQTVTAMAIATFTDSWTVSLAGVPFIGSTSQPFGFPVPSWFPFLTHVGEPGDNLLVTFTAGTATDQLGITVSGLVFAL